LSSGRAGDECSFRELFKAAQETCASHASCSFDKKLTPPATAELSVFDETGRSLSSQHASDPPWRKITDGATVARFVLGGRPPAAAPRHTEAILLAERVHAALVELSDGSAVFTGCDGEKRPLSGHAHAYILPESIQALGRGRSGEITSVTMYAPAGFGSREIGALEDLREVGGSGFDVQLALLGLGHPGDFGGTDAVGGESPPWPSPASGPHGRLHLHQAPQDHSRRGAEARLLGPPDQKPRARAAPSTVEPVSFTDLAGQRTDWSSFRRARSCGDWRRAGSAGYGFRIEFP
jgi:hypothetical protein